MTVVSSHEMPVRAVLDELLGTRVSYAIKDTRIIVGNTATQIEPDCVIDGDVVVEIESRTPKQIRGAIMDLLFHPRPKKLLIIRPVNANPMTIKGHCEEVFRQCIRRGHSFAVVLLPRVLNNTEDGNAIRQGLNELGIEVKGPSGGLTGRDTLRA